MAGSRSPAPIDLVNRPARLAREGESRFDTVAPRDAKGCDTMKTATARELRYDFATIAAWLDQGETVILTRRGKRVGRIVPEPKSTRASNEGRRALFASRFAPWVAVPQRDLSGVIEEHRGAA